MLEINAKQLAKNEDAANLKCKQQLYNYDCLFCLTKSANSASQIIRGGWLLRFLLANEHI